MKTVSDQNLDNRNRAIGTVSGSVQTAEATGSRVRAQSVRDYIGS